MLQFMQEKDLHDSQKKNKGKESSEKKGTFSSGENKVAKTLQEISVILRSEEIGSDSDY